MYKFVQKTKHVHIINHVDVSKNKTVLENPLFSLCVIIYVNMSWVWKHLLENDNKAMCMLCNMPLNFSIMNLNFRCCCVLQTANWFENGNVQPIFIFCSILCDLIIIIQSMLQIEPIFRNPLPSRSADLLYCVHRATICWPDSSDFFVFLGVWGRSFEHAKSICDVCRFQAFLWISGYSPHIRIPILGICF